MKVQIIYPLPLERPDVWAIFAPFAKRFADTFRLHNPGADYELLAMCCQKEPTEEIKAIFAGLQTRFVVYEGDGADIGAFQHAAAIAPEGVFMVCCVSRVYFHRPLWLARLIHARHLDGPGLYGTSASYEGGKLHVCCRCYAMDAADFRQYPVKIVSRDQGVFFELGKGNLLEWYQSRKQPAIMVYWNGIVPDIKRWFSFSRTFRNGDQANMLVWDKHSDAYRDANEETKTKLTTMMLKPL